MSVAEISVVIRADTLAAERAFRKVVEAAGRLVKVLRVMTPAQRRVLFMATRGRADRGLRRRRRAERRRLAGLLREARRS